MEGELGGRGGLVFCKEYDVEGWGGEGRVVIACWCRQGLDGDNVMLTGSLMLSGVCNGVGTVA